MDSPTYMYNAMCQTTIPRILAQTDVVSPDGKRTLHLHPEYDTLAKEYPFQAVWTGRGQKSVHRTPKHTPKRTPTLVRTLTIALTPHLHAYSHSHSFLIYAHSHSRVHGRVNMFLVRSPWRSERQEELFHKYKDEILFIGLSSFEDFPKPSVNPFSSKYPAGRRVV